MSDLKAKLETIRDEAARNGEACAHSRLWDLLEAWSQETAAEARIEEVRALHRPFRIYDECGHEHTYDADGDLPEGVLSVEAVGLTCDEGYLYSICWSCCTSGSGYQSVECVDHHDLPCWPCPTAKAVGP